jgi:sulfatase modifying factor 1
VKAGQQRSYPWADQWDGQRCNNAVRFAGRSFLTGTIDDFYYWPQIWVELNWAAQGLETTTPVGAYSPVGDSPYGCSDMAGNVSEWVADWLGWYPFGRQANPTGPDSDRTRGVRGGSWLDSFHEARCTHRDGFAPGLFGINRGFRCARSS